MSGSWETAELLALTREREAEGDRPVLWLEGQHGGSEEPAQDQEPGLGLWHILADLEGKEGAQRTTLRSWERTPLDQEQPLSWQQLISPTTALWDQNDDNANSPEHPAVQVCVLGFARFFTHHAL